MATITQLPLDLKGTLSSNRRTSEVHTLTRANGKTNRMFAPEFGAYYKDSLEVREGSGKVLKEDVDYVTTYYYDEIWELTAKSACAIIVIVNPSVSNTVRITYQALGGHYSLSVKELAAVLAEVDEYPEDIGWDDIRGKPLQFFPEDHEHELWQLYGFESTVVNLDMISTAWAAGRKGVLEDNRYYYRNVIELAKKAVLDYTTKVMAHINDKTNPHKVDKIQIGLSEINNWGMATVTEGKTKTVNNKYQPIGSVYDQLVTHVIPFYDQHIRNLNNPHNVTLSDPLINAYSRTEIMNLLNARLARTETAYNSNLFSGLDTTAIYNSVRSGLDTSFVQPNVRLPQVLVAPPIPGWNPSDYALAGNNSYVAIANLMKNINDTQGSVYFIGAEPLTAWAHLSVGTFVIRTTFQDFNDYRQSYTLSVYEKTSSGYVPRTRT